MKKILTLSIIVFSSVILNAQSESGLWKSINEKEIPLTGKRDIVPEKYKTAHLDLTAIKNLLASAPLDKNTPVEYSSVIIGLPMPDGTIQNFKVSESPVMDDALQFSFPDI